MNHYLYYILYRSGRLISENNLTACFLPQEVDTAIGKELIVLAMSNQCLSKSSIGPIRQYLPSPYLKLFHNCGGHV
jgi:hypothetical protein